MDKVSVAYFKHAPNIIFLKINKKKKKNEKEEEIPNKNKSYSNDLMDTDEWEEL